MFKNSTNQQKGSLLAFIAVVLITPDSLLIRLSNIETWGMLFYRGAIPFVVVAFSPPISNHLHPLSFDCKIACQSKT